MAVSTAILLARSAGAQDNGNVHGDGIRAGPAHPRSLTEGRDCHSVDILEATTNWSTLAKVPQFDPALGILRSIEVRLSAKMTGDASVESLDARPSDTTLQFASTVTLMRPRGGTLVEVAPRRDFEDHLLAFDGTVDFAGASGVSHLDLVVHEEESPAVATASDLPLFTGKSGVPSTIDLPISAVGTSSAEGAGNMVAQFRQAASALVTVCYVFDLDCNGNSVADADDIAGGAAQDVNDNKVPDQCEPSVTRFCFGDGAENGGPDCICGNSTPNNTGGCVNSTGLGGRLDGTGTPSVSADTLHLLGVQLSPGVPTFFLQGTSMKNSGLGVTFGEGLLCISGVMTHLAKIQSSPENGGPVIFPADGDPPISDQLGIQPGETRTYQIWYRSPGGRCDSNANTTNGVLVVWGS